MNKELIIILVWLSVMGITFLNTCFSKKEPIVRGNFFVSKVQNNSGPNPCNYSCDTISIIKIADIDDNLFISK